MCQNPLHMPSPESIIGSSKLRFCGGNADSMHVEIEPEHEVEGKASSVSKILVFLCGVLGLTERCHRPPQAGSEAASSSTSSGSPPGPPSARPGALARRQPPRPRSGLGPPSSHLPHNGLPGL